MKRWCWKCVSRLHREGAYWHWPPAEHWRSWWCHSGHSAGQLDLWVHLVDEEKHVESSTLFFISFTLQTCAIIINEITISHACVCCYLGCCQVVSAEHAPWSQCVQSPFGLWYVAPACHQARRCPWTHWCSTPTSAHRRSSLQCPGSVWNTQERRENFHLRKMYNRCYTL